MDTCISVYVFILLHTAYFLHFFSMRNEKIFSKKNTHMHVYIYMYRFEHILSYFTLTTCFLCVFSMSV